MTADELRRRFRDTLRFDLHEVSGATLIGDIPVPEALANRLIAERLARAGGPVSAAVVHPREGDQLEVRLTIPRLPMVKELSIQARIERQPTPADPVLRLRWSMPSLGPLATFAGGFVSRLRDLPPGVRIDGETIAIDIRELASARGFGDLLNFVTDVQLHTRPGLFLLKLGLKAS